MPRSQALACVGHLASLGSGGGGPAPRQPSAAPHGHWAWRAEAAWARTAQMSYGRGHAFSQERLQTVAHTLLSFWNAVPSSKLNPLVLAAWRPLFPVHLGPQWPPQLWLHLPALAWGPGAHFFSEAPAGRETWHTFWAPAAGTKCSHRGAQRDEVVPGASLQPAGGRASAWGLQSHLLR